MKILRYLHVAALALAVGLLTTGCEKDSTEEAPKKPSLQAELVSAASTTAELRLVTNKIVEAAYAVTAVGDDAPEAAVIFASGTRGFNCTDGENLITVRNLAPLTDYVVYVAGITDTEEYCEQVAVVTLSTTDFAEDVAAYDITSNSFKVRVRVPDNLAESGNVLKWGLADLAMYNMNSKMMMYTSAEVMNLNDEYYHNYFSEDKVFSFSNNAEDIYVLDENGEPELDPWSGDYKYYYEPIVPGGKYVTMFGEFSEGESTMGWGMGYYNPLFDYDGYLTAILNGETVDEANYWTGYYAKLETKLAEPEVLNAKVDISLNLRPSGGVVSFTPEEGIEKYVYTLMDETTYQEMLNMLLDGDESNLQWFFTTTLAMVYFNAVSMNTPDPVDIVIEDFYYNVDKTATYHAFAVGLGNSDGTAQSFSHETFKLPEPTKPAPTLQVVPTKNPNGEESPYEVWFNVKAPNQDALTGMYVCNYERDWMSMINIGYTAEDLLSSYGVELSSEEIGQINTAEGLNISFPSYANTTTYLAVKVANDEGTESEAEVAMNTTIAEPPAEPVTSELFTDLLGDWTATTTIEYSEYNYETLTYEKKTAQKTSKVTIGDVGYEATLPDEVYDLFFNSTSYTTKEEVDALYEQFKDAVDTFNKNTRDQNRLLCQGLSLQIVTYYDYLQYASPYDLFTSDTYNSDGVESIIFDFGPKWYLQIAADGSVSVPFNMNRFAPLSNWYYSQYYLLGVNADGDDRVVLPYIPEGTSAENGYFPAEVSADKNTITIKPLNYNGSDYYMNPGTYSYGYYNFSSIIISDITLTRGWTEPEPEPEAQAAYAEVRKLADPLKLLSRYDVKPVAKHKSRTAVAIKPAPKRKQVTIHHIPTHEEVNAKIEQAFKAKKYGKR